MLESNTFYSNLQLTTLDLRDNIITTIEKDSLSFGGHSKLQKIYLNSVGTKVSHIPSLGNSSSLKEM